jgi:hypothetical protein
VEVFKAEIIEANRGGAYVRVPPEVAASLGGKGRVAVRASFDGIAYRGSVVTMGGEKVLGVLKSIRAEPGKGPGEAVTVTVERDQADRLVEIPADLRAGVDSARLHERLRALSYTHQREYVSWIEAAKRAETRARRIDKTIEGLST